MSSLVEKIRKRLDRKFLKMVKEDRLHWLPDKLFLSWMFRIKMGYKLNWKNPVTFDEKLNWIKVYDRNPLYTRLVDKYAVKEYVSGIIGAEHVAPTFGVWDKFDDIDFDSLPDQFVLKCSHDSGGLVVCKDKSKLDLEKAREIIEKSLKRNYYYKWREWPYKNVRPRILAEKYLEDSVDNELRDYKFHTFNGEPRILLIASNRHNKEKKGFDFFDMNLQPLDLRDISVPNSSLGRPHPPKNFDKMRQFCRMLAKDFPCVRVDFYEVNGHVYFGEMTFFDDAGFMRNTPSSWEKEWGDMITLSPKRR